MVTVRIKYGKSTDICMANQPTPRNGHLSASGMGLGAALGAAIAGPGGALVGGLIGWFLGTAVEEN